MNKIWLNVIKWTVTLVLLLLVYWQLQGELANQDFLDPLTHLQWGWLWTAIAVYFVSLIFSAMQWAVLLRRQGIEIDNRKAVRLYFVGLFFSNFLLGNVGGDLKRVYDVNQDSQNLMSSVTATLFDRVFGLYTLSFISLVAGGLFFLDDFELGKFLMPCLLIFVALNLGFCGLFSMRLGNKFEVLFRRGSRFRLMEKYHSLRSSFQKFRAPRFLGGIFVFSFLIQSLRIYTQVLMAKSLGIDLALEYYFFLVPIIGIITSIPISIGGFGPREFAAQRLMGAVGWSPLQAVIWQLIGYMINVFLGLFGVFEFLFGKKKESHA